MPGPVAIPPQLLDGPFTLARADELGVSRKVLRGGRFWTPIAGVRAAVALPDSLELRARSVLLLAPHVTFSHLTAARLCPVAGAGFGGGRGGG